MKKIPPEWSVFVKEHMPARSSGIRQYHRARGWSHNGCGLPAKASKIHQAAQILRCDARLILDILFPGAESPESVELSAKRARMDKNNSTSRARWHQNPDCSARKYARSPKAKAYMARWQLKRSKFHGDRGALFAYQREVLRANATKAWAAQGKTCTFIDPKVKYIRQIHRARNALAVIGRSLDRMEKKLAVSASRYSKPWFLAGFSSLEKWADSTEHGREYRRKLWQCKSHKRDARVRSLPGSFSLSSWYILLKSHGYSCAYCGKYRKDARKEGHDLEIDHIYPIGHPWSANCERNIVPACKSCNTSKSDNDLIEWARAKNIYINPMAMQKYQTIRAENTKEISCQA